MVYAARLHTGLGAAAVTIVLFCIPTQTAEVVEGKWAGVHLQVISNSEFLNNIDSTTTSKKKKIGSTLRKD